MKLHPDIERKVLQMAGLLPEPIGTRQLEDLKLVEASFSMPGVWVLPIRTASEANGREWRERSRRTQAARKIVSVEFAKRMAVLTHYAQHYHAGRMLCVNLTRLGGRKLDAANLPSSLKATEDAVALMLGADDGSPNWSASFDQKPAGLCGVHVELIASGVKS